MAHSESYKDIAVILAETKTSNDAAFSSITGLDLTKTIPLKNALKTKMTELYDANKLNDAQSIAVAWQELSQGLRKVSK